MLLIEMVADYQDSIAYWIRYFVYYSNRRHGGLFLT